MTTQTTVAALTRATTDAGYPSTPREGHSEMSETMLAVTGMTCMDCAHHVEQALRGSPACARVRVEYPNASRGSKANFRLR